MERAGEREPSVDVLNSGVRFLGGNQSLRVFELGPDRRSACPSAPVEHIALAEVSRFMTQSGKAPFRDLAESFKAGAIDRRQFLARAAALGVAPAVAVFMANAAPIVAAGGSRNGFAFYAQDATPAAGPSGFPDAGMEGRTRGEGGELKIIQWQAATSLDAHRTTGDKDYMTSDIVNEPLIRYAEDGSLLPNLITEVPSVENGQLAEDLSTATFTLIPDVLWSDGEPFTANDVKFTWQWVTTESNAAVTFAVWDVIEDIEVVDDLTAKITFKTPSAAWFDPFAGGRNGHILPSHVFGDDPANANEAFISAPIGTGSFVVSSFTPNDSVSYTANENYREPNKPFFATVTIKGGGDAASAARAVLETGEYDYAWNLQVEPAVLDQMLEGDPRGQVVVAQGTSVERININFSDPNTEVDGQRSEVNTPNPILTDKIVRDALNVSVNRQLISDEFYGEGEPPTANVLTGLAAFDSPNTAWVFDLDAAAQALDEAGWVLDGDVRSKDGVELNLTYATSVNQVRQKTQQVVKADLESIGFKVGLEQVDAGIYFDSAAGNDQNIGHFYWDINMYTNNATSSVPIAYMQDWYAGPENSNVSQKANQWQGTNRVRWVNADYDATFEELQQATTLEDAFELLIQLNDMIFENVVVVPIVNRAADKYAISNRLRNENVAKGVGFEYNYWNIANWNTVEGQ
jgi:peptide/nickel transport system substrate-binding protein